MPKLYLLAAMVAGACGFTPTVRFEQDAAQGSAGDPGTVLAQCHVSDPALRLCLDFEDVPLGSTVRDLANHHDGSADGIAAVHREQEQAAGFVYDPLSETGSEIVIAETPDLDIPDHLTYELYLLNPGLPQDDVWPVDNFQQYGVKFTNDHITCYAGGEFADSAAPLGTGWHHIACTYGDG